MLNWFSKLKICAMLSVICMTLIMALVFRVDAATSESVNDILSNYDNQVTVTQSNIELSARVYKEEKSTPPEVPWEYQEDKYKILRFIKYFGPGAIHVYEEYGLSPSTFLTQGALESGWGKHSFGYNMFGIKYFGACSEKVLVERNETIDVITGTGKMKAYYCGIDGAHATVKSATKEYYDGEYHDAKSSFRVYLNADDAAEGYAAVLTKNRYNQTNIRSNDYNTRHKAIKAGGYATSGEYVEKLNNTINTSFTVAGEVYKLYEIDQLVKDGKFQEILDNIEVGD